MKKFYLALYYLIARRLPSTSMPGGQYGNKLRNWLARRIFKYCGNHVIVKHGAYFGNGKNIEIGDYSQIGENARISSDTVIGEKVMMGLEVMTLSTIHASSRTDVPLINKDMRRASP